MTATPAKPPRPLRLNQRAALIPTAQFARWHELAIQTVGLTKTEVAILDIVAGYYRLLYERGYASSPTIEAMADSANVRSIDITGAIKRLVELGLVAVQPGSGRSRNEYRLCLPRRVAASMATVALADEEAPPF
jgi:hypothetical protein